MFLYFCRIWAWSQFKLLGSRDIAVWIFEAYDFLAVNLSQNKTLSKKVIWAYLLGAWYLVIRSVEYWRVLKESVFNFRSWCAIPKDSWNFHQAGFPKTFPGAVTAKLFSFYSKEYKFPFNLMLAHWIEHLLCYFLGYVTLQRIANNDRTVELILIYLNYLLCFSLL